MTGNPESESFCETFKLGVEAGRSFCASFDAITALAKQASITADCRVADLQADPYFQDRPPGSIEDTTVREALDERRKLDAKYVRAMVNAEIVVPRPSRCSTCYLSRVIEGGVGSLAIDSTSTETDNQNNV